VKRSTSYFCTLGSWNKNDYCLLLDTFAIDIKSVGLFEFEYQNVADLIFKMSSKLFYKQRFNY